MPDHLADAVDATLKRMAAQKEERRQLERRRAALRGMHLDDRLGKAEVGRVFYEALREQGLTFEELKDQGVTHESVMKILREV